MKKIKRIALVILIIPFSLLLILVGYSIVNEIIKSKSDMTAFPVPGNIIEVKGTNLHIYSTGEKIDSIPTVVLEAGGGMCSPDWQLVQNNVSNITRVCSWDRPGYGWSEISNYPRTSLETAKELHELLLKNGEKPPYLLVGHSYGGHTIRIFASLFPEEVYGLIYLDARPDDMLKIPVLKTIGAPQTEKLEFFSFLSKIGITRLIGQNMIPVMFQEKMPNYPTQICFRTKYFDANVSEAQNIALSDDQVKKYKTQNEFPTIVIRHGIPDIFSILSPQDSLKAENEWKKSQERISSLSSNSEVWIAERSGHNIHIEQPEIVIQAIENLLNNYHQQ